MPNVNKVIALEKSFATHPKSIFWSDLNELKPCEVFRSSNVKYLFDCNVCGHCFDIPLKKITRGQWCGYCFGDKICNNINCTFCFEKSFASHHKSEFWSDENELKPREVSKCSGKKYIFDCNICNHCFDAPLDKIVYGQWCSYCNGDKICTNLTCEYCFNKSFASHEKSDFWSEANKLKPREVLKCSNVEFWFDCNICDHIFSYSLNNIVAGRWCSYCYGNMICDNITCKYCFKKAFVSHEKSKFWSDVNKLKPREVSKSSHVKFWFDCSKCNHRFRARLDSVVSGQWCPFCANIELCDNIECEYCYNKSFQSHKNSKFWSNENMIDARSVFKHSDKIFGFFCGRCKNEFKIRLSSVCRGQWCHFCINKTEQLLYEFVKQTYNDAIKGFKVDWCKNKLYLPFDIVIPHLKIIIELDGPQHFEQIAKWKSPKITQETDIYKMNCAIHNCYFVIRLLQIDVFNDNYNWKLELINTINELINKKDMCVVYMCKKNEYNVYKQYPVSFVSFYKT